MDRIFISHAAEDADVALPLAAGIEEAGYPTWYYERDSAPGPSYLAQIVRAIAAAPAVVVVLSPVALRSWQVEKEVIEAHEHGKPLVPLLRDLTHGEFRVTRPDWAMVLGAATSHPVSPSSLPAVLARLLDGLRLMFGSAATRASALLRPDALRQPAATVPPLPIPQTPLIGRSAETARAASYLREGKARLLTLTGVGGVGKTRVAVEVARDLLPAFPDGVYFVALAAVHEPAEVIPAIAAALGLRDDGTRAPHEAVRSFLHDKAALLVLDNCEQVLRAAPLILELLAACPRLAVLATSRERLRVRGERLLPIPPLAGPNLPAAPAAQESRACDQPDPATVAALAACPAVALFVARVQDIRPEFDLDPTNAATIAAICAHLDGLPLALELAAAWMALLSPDDLLNRLEHRLSLLTGGARDLPARQRTLRATIDWSYTLLSPAEQRLFARLSIFTTGWTLDAVETVCGGSGGPIGAVGDREDVGESVLIALAALIDKSLVQADASMDGGQRFNLLETLREYALEKLDAAGESEWLRARHALYYLSVAEEADRGLRGAEQGRWLMRLEREHDNLAAALRWACTPLESGDGGSGRAQQEAEIRAALPAIATAEATRASPPARHEIRMRLAGALWWYWLTRGHLSEGQHWFELVLALDADDGDDDALNGASDPAPFGHEGACPAATSAARHRAGVLDTGQDRASTPDVARGPTALHTALRAKVWRGGGALAWSQSQHERATTLLRRALAVYQERHDDADTAVTLLLLGHIRLAEGDLAAASDRYQEGLALYRRLGDTWGIAVALTTLGNVALDEGAYAEARRLYEEALPLSRSIGDLWNMANVLNNLGGVSWHQGEYARARALYDESLALQQERGDQLVVAMTLHNLSLIDIATGSFHEAAARLRQSLRLFADLGYPAGVASCLENIAVTVASRHDGDGQPGESPGGCDRAGHTARSSHTGLHGSEGQADGAGLTVRLLGVAERLRQEHHIHLSALESEQHERLVADLHRGLGATTYAALWQEGTIWPLDQAVVTALTE